METLAIKLVNLGKITFETVHFDTIYTLIQYSIRLKSIRFAELYIVDENNINRYILAWNEARKNLQPKWIKKNKITIYVIEKHYLAAKWASIDNLSNIEVRRDGYCPI